MTAEAVIFDKDGTLIDFDDFWVTVSISAIKDVLKRIKREDIPLDELLNSIGVKNGITDIDGVLCKGTYEQIGIAIYDVLKSYGCDVSPENTVKMVIDAYNDNADAGEIKPTCDNLSETLLKLKKSGKKLIVVTTDNYEITHKCLEALKIENYFERIYTDDGKTPVKPNPECVFKICEEMGISKDKIIMVGDTMTDVKFARNAGISVVGVVKSENNRLRLGEFADYVITDVSKIFDVIEEAKK